jgi:hypothetical protein
MLRTLGAIGVARYRSLGSHPAPLRQPMRHAEAGHGLGVKAGGDAGEGIDMEIERHN